MTNKIKPFCVDTKAENLSDEQIKQLHKWCVDAGASLTEGDEEWVEDKLKFPLIVVDKKGSTLCESIYSPFNGIIIKFQDVPSYLGLVNSEKSVPVETSVNLSGSFYTKLNTLLDLYPVTLSKDHTGVEGIKVYHSNFGVNFFVKNEEDLLKLLKSFDTLDKLAEK